MGLGVSMVVIWALRNYAYSYNVCNPKLLSPMIPLCGVVLGSFCVAGYNRGLACSCALPARVVLPA